MKESTRQLLQQYHDSWKSGDSWDKEPEEKRKKMRDKFNSLPLEEQYEVLLEGSKSIKDDGTPEPIYYFLFRNNNNSRIIEILNNQFPNGIRNPKEFSSAQKRDDVMSFELYSRLLEFMPSSEKYQEYQDLVEKTTIFKDERGNIDSKKIVEYWSNPDIKIQYKEKYFPEIFRYLDPDNDRARNN